MPEYRGIVNPAEVKATPVFDFNTVIENVQKSLTDSEAARQANRDKLEKDTNEAITAMSKVTLGKDEALNVKLTEAAYNSKQAIGAYAKLVREGKATQKDFNIFNGNLKGTFDTIDSVGKNAKAAYETYIAENNAGNLSAASDYMAKTLGLAASLENKNIIIDPKSGRGFIAGQDPNDMVEVNWLNNQRNLLIPKVKMDAELDAQADKIKDYAKYGQVGAGGIWVINDPTKRKEFEIYENNVANGITGDKLRAMSVLVDYGDSDKTGKGYSVTINAEEAKKDPRKIFIKLNSSGNPEPVFTPEQEQEARSTVKRYLRQRLPLEEKQVESTWRGFAPKEGKEADITKEPSISLPADKYRTIKDKVYTTGSSVGVKNITIKVAPGVTEQIDKFGVENLANGKKRYFLEYTQYKGKEVTKDDETTTTDVVSKKDKVYSDVTADEFLSRLNLIPNPLKRGSTFKGVEDIQDYIDANKAPSKKKGFNPDAYYNQQISKK